MLISSQCITKHGCHGQFLFLVGWFLKILWNCLAKWTETWWEAPMEGSVLSFLKAEWQVSDMGWAEPLVCNCFQGCPLSGPCFSVSVSYHLLQMNRVPGDCYLYTRPIKQKQIGILLLYSKCYDSRMKV